MMAAAAATAVWKDKVNSAWAEIQAHPLFANLKDLPPLPIAVSAGCDPRSVHALKVMLQCPWLAAS